MKKKTEPVLFKINLPELAFLTTTKLNFVHRDIDEFKKFGFTVEKLSSIEKMVTEFLEFPTDSEFLGDQMIHTQARNALAVTLRVEMTAILTRARNKFGIHSAYYRWFGPKRVSSLYGIELLLAAKTVHRVGNYLLEELADEGLTPEILSDFNNLVESFESSMAAQEDAASDRVIATMERVKRANQLYKTLVKICYTGKRIWESKNEAKYNDYVIYKNQPKKKKAKAEVPETATNKGDVTRHETDVVALKEQPEQSAPIIYPRPLNTDNSSLRNKEAGEGLKDDDAD